MATKPTRQDQLQSDIISKFKALLIAYETDITSGIEDKIYDAKENKGNLKFIAEAKEQIAEFEKQEPQVCVFVGGGLVQTVFSSLTVGVTVYDRDNWEGCDEGQAKEFIDAYGHPDGWEDQITDQLAKNEIVQLF